MKTAFIGGGVMGEAMVKGLLAKGIAQPRDIVVGEPSPSRQDFLKKSYGVGVTSKNTDAVPGADVVVLAVKPQHLAQAMADLKGRLQDPQTVLSIVAGAPISKIREGLGHEAIVRVMPNTPGQIGQGISVWTATPAVTPQGKQTAQTILSALGKEIYVPDEHYIDMATAVNGSGPAYVFLFLEAFTEAAAHIGIPWEMARELVQQTVLGSVMMTIQSGKHPAELKEMVSSPGGTTVEGLLKLEEGGFRALLTQAVVAAYEKSRALGK